MCILYTLRYEIKGSEGRKHYRIYLKYKKGNHLDVLKDKLLRVLLIVKELKSYI